MNIIEAVKLLQNGEAKYITNDYFSKHDVKITKSETFVLGETPRTPLVLSSEKHEVINGEYFEADIEDVLDDTWRAVE